MQYNTVQKCLQIQAIFKLSMSTVGYICICTGLYHTQYISGRLKHRAGHDLLKFLLHCISGLRSYCVTGVVSSTKNICFWR